MVDETIYSFLEREIAPLRHLIAPFEEITTLISVSSNK